ncbi:MAG: chorismate synthase [bacterium]|nr:chorismate synthase [bacterium]
MRYLTAGESHGYALNVIIDGVPSNVKLQKKDIDTELQRRQAGYGRGTRMLIETDEVTVVSGVRNGMTTGSPVSLLIRNRDWENWKNKSYKETLETKPRPGHADLAGALKFDLKNIRDVLERSSARETAARTAVGAVAKKVLRELDIGFYSSVINIGGISSPVKDYKQLKKNYDNFNRTELRCMDKEASVKMKKRIDQAVTNKDSLGGVIEVLVENVPLGLGSFTQYDQKLDAALAAAIMSIQAFKGVEIGDGFSLADRTGRTAHDEIFYSKEKGFFHKTNHSGGIEGGMSNGEDIIFRAVMKPIPTLMQPLKTVDLATKKAEAAFKERSDVCAVPSASIIAENVAAVEILKFVQLKFGGDSIRELRLNLQNYLKTIR